MSLKNRLDKHSLTDLRPLFIFVATPIILIVSFGLFWNFPDEHPWNDLAFFIIGATFFGSVKLFYTFNELKEYHDIAYERFPTGWNSFDAHDELRTTEIIGYVVIPIMIIFSVIAQIGFYYFDIWNDYFASLFGGVSFQKIRIIASVLLVFYIWILFLFYIGPANFLRFYLAKISFDYVRIIPDRVDKMKCYMSGLKNYNRFLARTLHIQLDEMKIYTKVLTSDSINVTELQSFFNCQNKLRPIKYFAEFTGNEELVTPVKNKQKTKEAIQFCLAVLPLVLLVLQIVFPELKSILD